jgi:hypothetical protein
MTSHIKAMLPDPAISDSEISDIIAAMEKNAVITITDGRIGYIF